MHFLILIFIFHSSEFALPWTSYMAICRIVYSFAATSVPGQADVCDCSETERLSVLVCAPLGHAVIRAALTHPLSGDGSAFICVFLLPLAPLV